MFIVTLYHCFLFFYNRVINTLRFVGLSLLISGCRYVVAYSGKEGILFVPCLVVSSVATLEIS